ncbi:MAG: DUF1294 domain-containing protein [Candidatus Gracilibacteria bacterium]|nr:DUF1294 domain-containing protein [Candidatus Gracilibacteria bacterium]MDD3120685.1 DUF1294 domain-containing protein [Candidatus Gracilibacteria bacterium]MDD4530054.1 DUF1294 domain-containing protein [Candidatus Gracilibacteria bacterium]
MFLFIEIYIIIINLVAFVIMFLDKRYAIKKKWRIREQTLFLLALAGGALGMFFGMSLFRHKTKHSSFRLIVPILIVLDFFLFYEAYMFFR